MILSCNWDAQNATGGIQSHSSNKIRQDGRRLSIDGTFFRAGVIMVTYV